MTQMELKDTARNVAESIGETIRDSGRDAFHAAKSGVAEIATAAGAAIRDEAALRAEEGKDMIADQGQRLASGLHDAAVDRGDGTVQSRLLDTIASSVSDASEGLRGRSMGEILEDAQAFARRHPGMFVAGAALAGFALARFAVASSKPVMLTPEAPVAKVTARPKAPARKAATPKRGAATTTTTPATKTRKAARSS